MLDLDFYYLRARNFLCFGPDGIELDLNKIGNIVLLKGKNLDRAANDEESQKKARNGCGKSSVPEILTYTLFGKTIRERLRHEDVIHNKIGNHLETEVRWGDFRAIRQRKPDRLQLWESKDRVWDKSTEITAGGIPATQSLIEEKLGLTYDAFVNLVIFRDNNTGSFLECNAETKRNVVENLLSLQPYREYHEKAKELRNQFKEKIDLLVGGYERLLVERDACEKRVGKIIQEEKDWKQARELELDSLQTILKSKRKELSGSDTGNALDKYLEAQARIKELGGFIPPLQEKQRKIKDIMGQIQNEIDSHRGSKNDLDIKIQLCKVRVRTAQEEVRNQEVTIKSFESKKGTKCPQCLGVVKEENYKGVVEKARKIVSDKSSEIEKDQKEISTLEKQQATEVAAIAKLNKTAGFARSNFDTTSNNAIEYQNEISRLAKINKPDAVSDDRVLESQIEELNKQITAKKAQIIGSSPYVAILQSAQQETTEKKKECVEKKAELSTIEAELPYYDFWVKGFGDSGIRKFIIEGIIPALNNRVAYWLQFLIDGKVKLTFDNELNELIERNPTDGDPFVYYGMSGGEKRRLNLAVSQAFAYIMMVNSGASPSLVFLDEVTNNIDPLGVEGVYNMIVELSRTKKVFVTTHDHDLLEMLSGCNVVNLVMKDGFTHIV